MAWGEKIANIVTGKSANERMQERAANQLIRAKQRSAYLQAKESESIRLARAKAKAETDYEIKKVQNRYTYKKQDYSMPFGGGSGMSIMGNSFGNSNFNALHGYSKAPITKQNIKPKIRRRHHKKGRVRTRVVYRERPEPREREQGFRII